ncbi:hypothetical protein FQA39_LY19320 [Lamprigera yunnana]|nr:hypothetical protein FQA39_LY19320 [Lamprigera yunnana]
MAATQVETVSSGADKLKLFAVAVLVIAGIAGFYLLSKQGSVVQWAVLLVGLIAAVAGVSCSENQRAQTRLRIVVNRFHAYSGMEKAVERNIQERINRSDMQNKFGRILVPTEEVVEVRNGQKKTTERRLFPGYVFVEMVMDDDTWHLVKHTSKVTGFVGGAKNRPAPISEAEVQKIVRPDGRGLREAAHKLNSWCGEFHPPSRMAVHAPFQRYRGRSQLRKESTSRFCYDIRPLNSG